MDPNFLRAVETVLRHEGGYVDHPADPGGATNYGISLRWLQAVGRVDRNMDGTADFDLNGDGEIDDFDMRALTRDQAIQLYHDHFWEPQGYAALPSSIGEKAFDLAVNMGPRQANKLLQRACRACGKQIAVDGLLGSQTFKTVAGADELALLAALRSEAAGFYRYLTSKKPDLNEFLNGWLTRAYS